MNGTPPSRDRRRRPRRQGTDRATYLPARLGRSDRAWRLAAGPYEVADDASPGLTDFVWICRRGSEVHATTVRVTEEAWLAMSAGTAPRAVAEAAVTRGRVQVIDAARAARPPSLVVIHADRIDRAPAADDPPAAALRPPGPGPAGG